MLPAFDVIRANKVRAGLTIMGVAVGVFVVVAMSAVVRGVNESFAGGTAVAMALVTGPLVEYSGLPATGLVAVLIALPPLSIWLMRRLRGHVVQAQLP